ncbi:MAG: aminotransferase class III-fold pyridoxal phosphate-dependent enzyme [Bacteroidetes bacterium]|nr:aminotransferase class III-fold pyridoxal phosphate-dependent enzyme [Bacteroidota bacterium]
MGKSQELYKEAKKLIPGGTQLLSKRPELFLPDNWPAYYESAKGCEVIDIDGNKYIDMITMGIGSCVLGYADDDINASVINAIENGSMTSLNVPEEVELAKLLIKIHPWAQMVRYARTGGEAMSVAVRIARAKSKKDIVLFCGYHGWHDWYISANLSEDKALDGHLLPGLEPLGIPRSLKDTSIPIQYNDTKSLVEAIEKYKGQVGVIVLEAIRDKPPTNEFLLEIRKSSDKYGIVFIVDEITSGFRLNLGGAHLLYGIEPDIAVFGKAIGNGFPMTAIIGKRSVMQAAQGSFISSTFWTDRIGTVAALATINKMQQVDLPVHLIKTGKQIQSGWLELAKKNGLKIHTSGIYPLSHFEFEYSNSLAIKTLFTQMMLEKGFLASTIFYASYAHKAYHVEKYLVAVDLVFAFLSKLILSNSIESSLKGPICHSGFKRLN